MSVIRWEDPPPRGGESKGRAKPPMAHELIAHQLRGRPGEWAVVYESTTATGPAALIRRGRLRAYMPDGAFEASVRVVDGVNVTYARYVGDVPGRSES